ncbi:DJ-1/PfpI family protein [Deinococcus roseus]|uniref:Glutamine amidotransferase n=1 Tax=Deinococcus roseus TaxID=392414 RepID=A0ABQ2DCP0_9DEIO|nr:DJ-1/PfpI family protein [Deinococcus roseus]GGJ52114.1 glutamine amidotransferase [Deinococcus roseus]
MKPKLVGKKIGILMESDFYDPEIWYYKSRFPEEGASVHFLSKLWGQPGLTFNGHEFHTPFYVNEAFTDMDDETLKSFDAIIIPAGFVSDRLRYTPDVTQPSDAVQFIKRVFAEESIVKGVICHGLWLLAWAPELVRGRKLTTHNNLYADAINMGAEYVNEDVVVDGDLITGRTGGHHAQFARAIIEKLSGEA